MQTQAPKRMRPELILLIIALFAAVLLVVMVVLCLPYFGQELSSEDAPPTHFAADPPPVTTLPEEAEGPTEPTLPPPEANPYDRNDFQYDGNYLKCLRTDSVTAIDVSAYQADIDWQAVKASGVDMAIVRVGYRGYGTGKLVEDEYVRENLAGASEAGLTVGAYIFSQAISPEEAVEEAVFLLNIIDGYDVRGHIVFDWEYISAEARTANVSPRTLTDAALEFCRVIEEAGYTPMVYFNIYQGNHMMYLAELKQYDFWLAWYSDRMIYPYKLKMWQYTCEGTVDGIVGPVDVNVYFPD